MITSGFLELTKMGYRVFVIILLSILIACKEKQSTDNNKDYHTYIQYTDSTYNKSLDTIKLLPEDSLSIQKLNGYFKVIDAVSHNHFGLGLLKNGIKIKTWKEYRKLPWGEVVLDNLSKYKEGKLNGRYIEYSEDGKITYDLNYKNNQQFGPQKEYDPEGRLVRSYNLNEDSNYIGYYLALNAKGDTLYYTNFSKEGTGYLKRYNSFGVLEMEGKIQNGKMNDYIEYEYDCISEKYIFKKYFIVTDTGVILKRKEEL
jgi:antitoxin component YwqK of YwqJK toxin-antitoxin module